MSSNSSSTPLLNKAGRAKLAKDTINNVIPHILKTNKRAQDGVNASELVHYSTSLNAPKRTSAPLTSTSGASEASTPIVKVSVVKSDTLDAVHAILTAKPGTRIAALNMASALRPGGGVLHGSLAQEETLCLRSTLYASLHPNWYRLPVHAGIYSPDILVTRSSSNADLPKSEWYYCDVISVAAPKQPEIAIDKDGNSTYADGEDFEDMVKKVRLIFQIAQAKGVKVLVLGALGCGAYRNPIEKVAKIFKGVIWGGRKREGVKGIEEVVLAIFDEGVNLRTFRKVFEEGE